jgi:hypothetical protein
MKNSNDTIGNRTRDLPACSEMPQPTSVIKKITPGDFARISRMEQGKQSSQLKAYFTVLNERNLL